jgi:hypothetical protein
MHSHTTQIIINEIKYMNTFFRLSTFAYRSWLSAPNKQLSQTGSVQWGWQGFIAMSWGSITAGFCWPVSNCTCSSGCKAPSCFSPSSSCQMDNNNKIFQKRAQRQSRRWDAKWRLLLPNFMNFSYSINLTKSIYRISSNVSQPSKFSPPSKIHPP